MRMKKFRQILALLPESEEKSKVVKTLNVKAERTKSFILRCKRIGRYLIELYLIISYLLQTTGIL